MKIITSVSEDEMIAEFLKAEIQSDRWRNEILSILNRDTVDRKIIATPNTKSLQENEYRKQVLAEFRGYGKNKLLFHNFPSDVRWKKAFLEKEYLEKVLYINWGYWKDVTRGTRLPRYLAEQISLGRFQDTQNLSRFLEAAQAIKNGLQFPPLIFVAANTSGRLVVLEGHLRLTAYLLAFDYLPKQLEIIIGFSKSISNWGNY